MASVTINTDLKSGSSDLVSAYMDNLILFNVSPNDTGSDVTAKLKIDTTYFDCFYTGVFDDHFYFKISVTELIRYFITNFYYKAVSAGINASTLVTSLTLTIYGYEDGVSTCNTTLTLYFSHGLNQIGYAYGSNLRSQYENAELSFTAFKDYPFELYFFLNASHTLITLLNGSNISVTASCTKGLWALKSTALNVVGNNMVQLLTAGSEEITSWSNSTPAFETLVGSGANLTIAAETSGGGKAITNNIAVTEDETLLFEFTLTKDNPESNDPVVKIGADTVTGWSWTVKKSYLYTAPTSGNIIVSIEYAAGQTGTFHGTFSVKSYTEIQTFSLIVKQSSCDGVYIRYLSKEGFYRYWLFEGFKRSSITAKKIGNLIQSLDTLVGAQSRVQNIGYNEVTQRVDVISHNVTQEQQEQLIDIFTSPAVYIWNGESGDASAEADWILLDEVQGQHEINYKRQFQAVSASLILPELYTQKR